MDIETLTWREQEILILLADRLTNREIALQLHLAESTVKEYVSRILGKLLVKNRRQAVARARELGLLDARRSTSTPPESNLPTEMIPFIGRQDDLAEIRDLLKATRLLTLTGPGGIGKSSLALKTAALQLGQFKNGSFFVPLASIDAVQDITRSIAEALQFPLTSEEDPIIQLVRYLRPKEILLVIDNFEHLLDGAPILSEILQRAPLVKILVTSRESLNLLGETIFSVRGMALPDHSGEKNILHFDSITLFLFHARNTRPSFNPTSEQQQRILEICRQVEGFPLAIELAAAWLHMLSLDEIAVELNHSFEMLSSQRRDAPKRHWSIRAVFDHTWSLLSAEERQLFLQLSVFRGGFNRDAATRITGASPFSLSSLVSKSIVHFDSATGRFGIHQLLRQFAVQRLETMPQTRLAIHKAHGAYFAKMMAAKWDQLKCDQQLQALAEIDSDLENIRSAWRFHLDPVDIPHLKLYINSFWLLHWVRGWNHAAVHLYTKGVNALEKKGDDAEINGLRARFQANLAFFLTWLGQAEQGYDLSKKCIKLLEQVDDFEGLIFAYNALTLAAYYLGRVSEEKEAADKMLRIAMRSGDQWARAFSFALAGLASLRMKAYSEAAQWANSCLEICQSIGDKVIAILALSTLGIVANRGEDLAAAERIYLRFLSASKEIGFHWAIGNSTKYLAQINLKKGNPSEAEAFFQQSLTIAVDLGLDRDIVNHLYDFALLRIAQQRKSEAIILLAAILDQPSSRQIRLESGPIRDNAQKLLATLKMEFPTEEFDRLVKISKNTALEEVIAQLL